MTDEWMKRKVYTVWIVLMILAFFGSWMWDKIGGKR